MDKPSEQEHDGEDNRDLPHAPAEQSQREVGEQHPEGDAERSVEHAPRPSVALQAKARDRYGHREEGNRVPEPPVRDRVRRKGGRRDLEHGGKRRAQASECGPDASRRSRHVYCPRRSRRGSRGTSAARPAVGETIVVALAVTC